MIKRLIYSIIISVVLLSLVSCTQVFKKEGRSFIIDEKTFIDDVGNEFALDKPYTKIVSLYSAHTENIFSLGKGSSLIGVNSTSIYPPEAAKLPVYDYKGDAEPLVALYPDLVLSRPFIDRNYPDYIRALKSAGITVISLYPQTNQDFEKYIEILSIITGSKDKVDGLFTNYYGQLDNTREKTSEIAEKKTVFFESTKTNYRTVTPDSNPAMAIEIAGGINIAGEAKPIKKGTTIAEFGIENLMMHADLIDVYISQRGAMNSGGSMISIPQREGFCAIKAVKDNKILELNEKIISSPTFRYYKGVNEIARILYPDVMDDVDNYRIDKMINREDYAILCVKINHTPIFVPSSSKYYDKQYYNHTYGMFNDVAWDDENFDYIETAVANSFILGTADGDVEIFDGQGLITKEDLALTIYIMGDYQSKDENTKIVDLEACENKQIVQKIVDHGLLQVDENGNFNPKENISYNFAIDLLCGVAK